MSSVFTLENIGVDCSQDVSCMLNDVFSNLLAADDIPKDRLVSMLHSKDNTCSSEDIGWGVLKVNFKLTCVGNVIGSHLLHETQSWSRPPEESVTLIFFKKMYFPSYFSILLKN